MKTSAILLGIASLATAKVRFDIDRNDHTFSSFMSLGVTDDSWDVGNIASQKTIALTQQNVEWSSDTATVKFNNNENTIVYDRNGLSTKYQLHKYNCDDGPPEKRGLSKKRADIRKRDPRGPGDTGSGFPHLDVHYCWYGGAYEDRIWGP